MSTDRNIIIDSDLFAEIINRFDNKAKGVEETLNNISNIMKNIDGENDTWRSDTALAVHEKYSELEKKFEKINAELGVYSVFLKETQQEYVKEEEKQEQAIDNYSEDLNIN